MEVINLVRELIKNKVDLGELNFKLPEENSETVEILLANSQDCLKKIKKKIKEKSAFTKQFKSSLSEAEKEVLKLQVRKVSSEIKKLESSLKRYELKLVEVIETNGVKATPTQFQWPEANVKFLNQPRFRVFQANDMWSNDWRRFLEKYPAHSSYHREEWLKALSEYSGFQVFLFALTIKNEIVAGVPAIYMKSRLFGKGMVSIPYVNYGGVLSLSDDFSKILLKEIKNWMSSNEVDYFELRMTRPGLNLPVKKQKCSMILHLPGSDEKLESNLGAKVRAQYKKAIGNKITITFGGIELMDEFYYVFSRNMRDLGTPVYGKSLFNNILKQEGIDAFLCIVRLNEKPVAVAFLTGYRDVLEIPWASTLRSANKFSVNMYMYRMILAKAIELGYEFFDFGRSTIDSNTYRFKKQWGAVPVEHFWYYALESGEVPETNPDNPKYRLAISVWRNLPVWLTNIIGPLIVKNIP